MARQTALVTGASSGIGRDLAHQFAAGGYDLVVVARRAAALDDLIAEVTRVAGVSASAIAADLTEPSAAHEIHDRLDRAGTRIDVVVNNAGFGLGGTVAALPLDRQLEMIQVNVTALTALTRLFLPGMVERNRGGMLNVGSTAAFQPGPLMAVYYATKAYVVSFTEAIAEEVAGSDLRVSCLCPGPTATEFADTAKMTNSNLFRRETMTAAEVARIGYDGWKTRQVVVVPGFSNRMGVAMVRVAPRSMVRRIVKRLNT
jgi:uncharacterized protein